MILDFFNTQLCRRVDRKDGLTAAVLRFFLFFACLTILLKQ